MALSAQDRIEARSRASAAPELDLSLPAEDRRSRPTFVDGRPLSLGQDATLNIGLVVEVVGPGRGGEWFMGAWREGDGVLYVGTFSGSQVMS